MKRPADFTHVYLCRKFIDFRKSINGLSALVQEDLKLDPFSKSLFVFCCKRKTKLKILYWDRTGFALWYKRLEEDRFPWPKKMEDEVIIISSKELTWLLDGIDFFKIEVHKEKNYQLSC